MGEVVDIAAVFFVVFVIVFGEAAASEVFEAACEEVEAEAVAIAAAFAVAVEAGGGGVVDCDGGDDADFFAVLVCDFGHGFEAFIFCVEADGAVVCFFATGDGRGSRGGIGDEAGGGAGASGGLMREAVADEWREARLARKFVSGHTLWGGHAVADEEDDIFGIRAGGPEEGERGEQDERFENLIFHSGVYYTIIPRHIQSPRGRFLRW